MKILFVDDEPLILDAYKRQFHKKFDADFACSGAEALGKLRTAGPFAVTISDMRMAGMSGTEYLSRARLAYPDMTRIMLTGNADQQTAMDAVNEGNIFRFLTKPCSPDVLQKAIENGISQYQLVTAEKEILEKTLMGSIGIMTELVALADPVVFGKVSTLRNYVREIAECIAYPNRWELELAALLSQIGHLTMPAEILKKETELVSLSPAENTIRQRTPEISYRLLSKIPRLGNVAQIVLYQCKHYNGAGVPQDNIRGQQIPLGARVLKILSDLIALEASGNSRALSLRLLHNFPGQYDSGLLSAISQHFCPPLPGSFGTMPKQIDKVERRIKQAAPSGAPAKNDGAALIEISFEDLMIGDFVLEDICALDGTRLLAKETKITETLLESLKNNVEHRGVLEPLRVAATEDDEA